MSVDQPAAVDDAARELVAAVRVFVIEAMRQDLRLQTQGDEDAADAYARACMEDLPERCLPALVAAHDALAAALNVASPGAPPILSLITEEPA